MLKLKKAFVLSACILSIGARSIPVQAHWGDWKVICNGTVTNTNTVHNHDSRGCKKTTHTYATKKYCPTGQSSPSISGSHSHSTYHGSCGAFSGSHCPY